MLSDEEMIIKEIKDHAAYWHSNMAKRITVEKHLTQKGVENVESKVDELIKAEKLVLVPKPRGDYLKVVTHACESSYECKQEKDCPCFTCLIQNCAECTEPLPCEQ